MKAPYLPGRLASVAILVSALLAVTVVSAEDAERTTESTHFGPGGRDARVAIKTTRDTKAVVQSNQSKVVRGAATKTGSETASKLNQDFWFYSADVVLYADNDFDGFYSGIDLLFDVDTIYSTADVYAVAFLSYQGGPWEEYASTEDFRIYGSTSTDDYSIVTDLVAGFPTGDYDLLIELYDAFNGDYLAFIGPSDTSELSFLPLEDIGRDTPPYGGETTVVVNQEGGGSASFLLLGLLSLTMLARRIIRRS